MENMTREERVSAMAAIKASAEEKARKYNEAIAENKFDDMQTLNTELTKLVQDYGDHAKTLCFEDCANSGEPMMAAIKRLTYTVIAVKDENIKEQLTPRRIIEDKERPIDLLALDRYVTGGIGRDKNWKYIAQKFNMVMTGRVHKVLGLSAKDLANDYDMAGAADDIDMGKNPDSAKGLLANLQKLITAMVGEEYKAEACDVGYLIETYSKKGRNRMSVACAKHTKFVGTIAEICNRIVEGGSYGVEYKRKKSA